MRFPRIPDDIVAGKVNSRVLNWLAPYAVEAFYGACAWWSIYAIPSAFVRFPAIFATSWAHYEDTLEGAAMFAGTFITIGLAMLPWKSGRPLSALLRAIGLGASGALWVSVGTTLALDNWPSLASIPFLLMGVKAWFFVLRWPPTPEHG